MNTFKSKTALALATLLFVSAPLSSVHADPQHNQVKPMQVDNTMTQIKSTLREYVQGVKADDTLKMQTQLERLLTLTKLPAQHMAMMGDGEMAMDHSQMNHEQMPMDHSQMNHKQMPMDHSQMNNEQMPMDHSQMNHEQMAMVHSQMNHEQMPMDHSAMTTAQTNNSAHHHMQQMHLVNELHQQFTKLGKAQNRAEIKLILAEVKQLLKNSQ